MAIVALKNKQRSIPIKSLPLKKTLLKILNGRHFQEALPPCLIAEQVKSMLEVSIVLVTDKQIQSLNLQFRGKDKITDVLSFPMYDFNEINNALSTADLPLLLGDIVISVPQASRQAIERGIKVEEEIMRLAIHGLLHLLGYDHEKNKKEAKKMKKLEDRLVKELMLDYFLQQ